MFYSVEHAMNGKVDDILAWLETDMRIIEGYYGEKTRVHFHAKREGNKIVVTGTMYELNEASMPTKVVDGFEECEGFIFEVSRITHERSKIKGFIADEKLFMER